jgi:hypothetical protein
MPLSCGWTGPGREHLGRHFGERRPTISKTVVAAMSPWVQIPPLPHWEQRKRPLTWEVGRGPFACPDSVAASCSPWFPARSGTKGARTASVLRCPGGGPFSAVACRGSGCSTAWLTAVPRRAAISAGAGTLVSVRLSRSPCLPTTPTGSGCGLLPLAVGPETAQSTGRQCYSGSSLPLPCRNADACCRTPTPDSV